MLEFLYLVCIAPLEFFMQSVLDWGFYTTHSFGLAIILMSLAVNTVILPVYNKVEGWQEEERALKARMAPMENMIREVFKGQERFAMISTLYRQHGYSQIMTLRASIGVLLQVPFFFAAYHLLSHMEVLNGVSFGFIRDLGAPDELFVIGGWSINVLPILMTVVNLVSAFFYTHGLSRRDKIQLYGMAALFLVLLYNSPAALTFYWTLNNVYSLGKNIVEKDWMKRQGWKNAMHKLASAWQSVQRRGASAISKGLDGISRIWPLRLINWSRIGKAWRAFMPASQKEVLAALYMPAAALILLILFVYCPFAIYSSDPALFSMGVEKFTAERLGVFFMLSLLICLIGVLSASWRWVLGMIFTLLVFIALCFCFLLAPDFGTIDAMRLQNPAPLHNWYNLPVDIAVIATLMTGFAVLVKFRKTAALKHVIYAAFTILLGMTMVHYSSAKETLALITKDSPTGQAGENTPPQYLRDFCTFSKNGKNVVVVMLDMFTGGNMPQVLNKYPELCDALDGFVWYEDTVTAGPFTIFGKPGIFAGKACHPMELSKDSSRPLEVKASEACGVFLRQMQDRDFRLSVHYHELFRLAIAEPFLKEDEKPNIITRGELWPEAGAYWAEKNNFLYPDVNAQDRMLTAIGLFNIAPLSVKKNIYRNGKWMNSVSVASHSIRHSLQQLAELDVLPEVSQVSEDGKNSYLFISNQLTHVPWGLDENGLPTSDSGTSASRDPKNHGLSPHHIRAEGFALKTLVRWFEWMKEQGVYDNTQIILASDHCRGDSAQLFDLWQGFPPCRLHGLMLVKEANARGPMRTDSTSQMASWDVPTLILNAFEDDRQKRSTPWLDKDRVRYHVNGDAGRGRHSERKFVFKEIYKIQGPLYDKKSWIKER